MIKVKDKSGKYIGKVSKRILDINDALLEISETEHLFVTVDNELIVSDVAIKGALLLDDKPSDTAYNLNGEWAERPVSKPEVTPETDTAFLKLIGAYSVAGSYPNKQAAMKKAVEALGEAATADELYEAAVANLS